MILAGYRPAKRGGEAMNTLQCSYDGRKGRARDHEPHLAHRTTVSAVLLGIRRIVG